MNSSNAQEIRLLQEKLSFLTNYLSVAQRRAEQGEVSLDAGIIQDARKVSQFLEAKIDQFQEENST